MSDRLIDVTDKMKPGLLCRCIRWLHTHIERRRNIVLKSSKILSCWLHGNSDLCLGGLRKCRALTCPVHTAPAGDHSKASGEVAWASWGPGAHVCEAGQCCRVHSDALAAAVFWFWKAGGCGRTDTQWCSLSILESEKWGEMKSTLFCCL